MSRLGLLEGNRVRYRMGAALVDPAAYEGSATARDFYTTDWMSPNASAQAYQAANAKTLDPEAWPTLQAFQSAHGGAPFQPDPGLLVAAPVTSTSDGPQNPPAYSDAEYRAQAIADQAEADRLAALPRDTVTGPTFIPDTQNAATAPSTVASTLPAATPAPSFALPLLAAVAAYFALKGH